MKRILFITAFPPNNQTAGQNYTRLLLNDISADNRVDVIYFKYRTHAIDIDKSLVIEEVDLSLPLKIAAILMFPFIFPLFVKRFKLRLLFYIRKIKNNYDILYFDFSQVCIYSLFIKHHCKMLMIHDVMYQKYGREKRFKIFLPFIKFSERLILNSGTEVLCFSEKDKKLLRELYQCDSTQVSFYLDDALRSIDIEKLDIENYFSFYGAWNRPENMNGLIWFLKNVYIYLPLSVNFKIIGGGMSDDIKKEISSYPNIEYLGFIDNPYPIICQSQALIAPLFSGAGVKVKVIEALATGTPVIGTSIAMEGLEFLKEYSVMYDAETADDYISILSNWSKITHSEKTRIRNLFLANYCDSSIARQLRSC